MASTARGRGPMVAGVVAIAGGIAVTVVLLLVARARVDDAVGDLARAPSGCDTTLDVTAEGTYVLFVETEGSIDELDGGCDAPSEYAIEGDVPRVRLDLTGPDGDEVDLDRVGDVTYDVGGYAGTAIRQTDLDELGMYVLRVESDDEVVVSVGKNPADAAGALPALAILAGLAGLAGGVVLIVVGAMRRRRPAEVPPASPGQWWQPVPGTAPAGPPHVPPPGPPIVPRPPSPWARPPEPGTQVPVRPPAGPPGSVFPPPPPPPSPPAT